MIFDEDIQIQQPRFDIRDPFGFGAIRRARYEYKRKAAECAALQAQLDEVYTKRHDAVEALVINAQLIQEKLTETERRLKVSDDIRKRVVKERDDLKRRFEELNSEYAAVSKELSALRAEHAELVEAHEEIVRRLSDGGEIG